MSVSPVIPEASSSPRSQCTHLSVCLAFRVSAFQIIVGRKWRHKSDPPLLCFCIPLGQGGGASADWQAFGQSPAVVGWVPGMEASLSGAVLSGAKPNHWLRPRAAVDPLALSHALLHRDPCLTREANARLSCSHVLTLGKVEQTAADAWFIGVAKVSHQCRQGWSVSRAGSRGNLIHILKRFQQPQCTSATWQLSEETSLRPHVTSIYEPIGYASPAGSGQTIYWFLSITCKLCAL